MVNVDVVDNNMCHMLKCYAPISCNVHICATAINSFVTVENKFMLELNDHVRRKDDPKRLVLDNSIT
jgi:hypothetical protein